MKERPSPNWDARPEDEPVDILVLHYTGMRSAEDALARLCDAEARVSSHYVVEENGAIWRLVAEERRAWHAGISHWRGDHTLNGRSIGIEIVNPGHEWGYRPFPKAQMEAVRDLCLGILGRHPIPPRNVVAHSDIAPDRKEDPGELFDWPWLAAQGVGLWPDFGEELPQAEVLAESRAQLLRDLALFGYPVPPHGAGEAAFSALLKAFQRHWRPRLISGRADAETARRAGLLVRSLHPMP